MTYDLKIRNGTIVDGTGAPAYVGDVGISDGRLAAVGDAPDSAREEIDATDRIVTPGFVDMHTHYDAQVVWDPMLSHSPWHGVTTVVMGNCGIGMAPCREADRDYLMTLLELVEAIPYECLKEGMGDWGYETYPQYLDYIERRGTTVNVVSQLGHHAVKTWVMGADAQDRFADEDEMDEQRAIVREALRAGAAGFSIYNGPAHWGPGGKPVPSRLSTQEQFESFLALIAEEGVGGIDLNWGPVFNQNTIPELFAKYRIQFNRPQTGTVTHNAHRNQAVSDAWKRGVRWNPQIGVLPNSFEVGLEDPFMFAIDQPLGSRRGVPLHDLFDPLTEMTTSQRLQTYKRAEFRSEFVRQTDRDDWNTRYWPLIRVSYSPTDTSVEGKRLVDLAKEADTSPAAIMLDLCVASDLAARFVIENPYDEDVLVNMYMDDAFRMGASDAGAHQGQIADYRYPTYFLSHFVREKGFPLERGIKLMTSMAAECYGIRDRGTLTAGLAADVNVIDLDTVHDGPLQRVNDLPGGSRRLFSEGFGIDHTFVNGVAIRKYGVMADSDEARPGTMLRDFLPHSQRNWPALH
jgi:N-acyl-D-aspartate/D-glutamate deacylase